MCQPKSQGGRRCLRHSAGTTAVVRYTESKIVSIKREEIYETVKELNKEGRQLEAPSTKEVNQFLDKEKFKAQFDPDLEERERKLIVKNLEKAKEEAAEQGVTGGAFHAWKNAFSRVMEKAKRPFAVLALSGILVGGLAGCTGGDAPNVPDPSGNPTTSYSIDIGDAVGGDTVTDDWGSYQHLLVDPSGSAYKFDEQVVDKESLEANGLTLEDAKKAQETAVKFLVEDVTDNPAIDIPEENFRDVYNSWNEENGPNLYVGDWYKSGDFGEGKHLTTLAGGLARDGKPRIETLKVTVISIQGYTSKDGTPGVSVSATIEAGYRVTDSWLKDVAQEYDINLGDDSNGMLSDGASNIMTIQRGAGVNVYAESQLISGANFPGYDTTDAFLLKNMSPSQWK